MKFILFIFSLILTTSVWAQGDEEASLPPVQILAVKNLDSLIAQARRERKVILLEMSASYCGFCRTLEAEIIKPMLRSGDYEKDVLIRQLEIDADYHLRDADGNPSTPAQIASRYKIYVTPTLLFIDGHGKEFSPRMLGINTLELYGGYVDQALDDGLKPLAKKLSIQ